MPAWHGPAWAYYEELGWIPNHQNFSDKKNSDTDWDIHFNVNFAPEKGGLRYCLDCDQFVPNFSSSTLI